MTAETRQLASFVANTHFADLPADLLERAKVYVLDNLAVGFIGSVQPWAEMVSATVKELGGNPQASVFNRGWRTDISRATLVNGLILGAFESEHVGHSAHPSATVFPAALATAESMHADGKSFLVALVLGYEVVCRVGAAQTRATEDERGFHNPGVNGAFGAATAVGRLMDLDELQLTSALGVAGSHACGLIEFIHEGAMTKRLHPGRAAQLGLESALLARQGFVGPSTVLEGPHGYLQAYSPSPQPDRLLAELGQRWLAMDVTPKAYPCHSTSQAVIHAIQVLKRTNAIDAQAIKQVQLSVEPRAAEQRFLDSKPRTLLGAQYSLVFSTAVALVRDLSNPYTFDEFVLSDPLVCELATRVSVQSTDMTPEVVITFADQSTVRASASQYPGSPSQPLDFAAAADKLHRYAAPLIGEARTTHLVDLVQSLETLDDVAPLAESIAAEYAAAPVARH